MWSNSGTAGLGLTIGSIAILIYFFVTSGRRSAVIVNGERVSALGVVSRFPGKSTITIVALALIGGYSSLSALNVLPPLYYGEMPNAYSKVTRETLKAVDGAKADPKAFEEAYKKFIRGK